MPLEIVWSPLALAQLREIRAYIALERPDAAERLATRIVSLTEALKDHPYLGRKGSQADIRELVIGGTPFIVLYRVRAKRVIMQIIWHGAQRREPR